MQIEITRLFRAPSLAKTAVAVDGGVGNAPPTTARSGRARSWRTPAELRPKQPPGPSRCRRFKPWPPSVKEGRHAVGGGGKRCTAFAGFGGLEERFCFLWTPTGACVLILDDPRRVPPVSARQGGGPVGAMIPSMSSQARCASPGGWHDPRSSGRRVMSKQVNRSPDGRRASGNQFVPPAMIDTGPAASALRLDRSVPSASVAHLVTFCFGETCWYTNRSSAKAPSVQIIRMPSADKAFSTQNCRRCWPLDPGKRIQARHLCRSANRIRPARSSRVRVRVIGGSGQGRRNILPDVHQIGLPPSRATARGVSVSYKFNRCAIPHDQRIAFEAGNPVLAISQLSAVRRC